MKSTTESIIEWCDRYSLPVPDIIRNQDEIVLIAVNSIDASNLSMKLRHLEPKNLKVVFRYRDGDRTRRWLFGTVTPEQAQRQHDRQWESIAKRSTKNPELFEKSLQLVEKMNGTEGVVEAFREIEAARRRLAEQGPTPPEPGPPWWVQMEEAIKDGCCD